MTDPFSDDSWDELTRELGVEKAPAPGSKTEPPSHSETEAPSAEEVVETSMFDDESPDDGEFDGDLGDESESEGDAPDGLEATPGDEQPGPGRKRRRRRRRRKKGPGEGEAETPADEDAEEPMPEPASRPARASAPVRAPRQEPDFAETEYDSGPFDDEPVGVPLAAEEDTAGEVLRELIANWNVPSWDSIITGLNRPER